MYIDLEDMVWLLMDVIYDMKKAGLDYDEEFQVLLEINDELKNNHNNIINDNPIQAIQKGIYEKSLSG